MVEADSDPAYGATGQLQLRRPAFRYRHVHFDRRAIPPPGHAIAGMRGREIRQCGGEARTDADRLRTVQVGIAIASASESVRPTVIDYRSAAVACPRIV